MEDAGDSCDRIEGLTGMEGLNGLDGDAWIQNGLLPSKKVGF